MQLDFSSEVPIYRQIRDQIVLCIAGGYLLAGDKLPTVRALANETGVNVMTISKAYLLLKQEGYIATERRGGTVVAGCTAAISTDETLAGLRLAAASTKLAGLSRDEWLKLCGTAYDGL